MRITITKDLFNRNPALFKQVGVEKDEFSWNHKQNVDLSECPKEKVIALRDGLKAMASANSKAKEKATLGIPNLISDCSAWLRLMDGEEVKPRSVEQFVSVLTEMIRKLPHKWVTVAHLGVQHHHFVTEVRYHPPERESPPTAGLYLAAYECGEVKERSVYFYAADIIGKTPTMALAAKDIAMETPESFEQYKVDSARYKEHRGAVGRQMICINEASDKADGNPNSRSDSWYWSKTNTYKMDVPEPSRVVIDVFREEQKADNDRRSRGRRHDISGGFWALKASTQGSDDEEEWTEEQMEAAHQTVSIPTVHNLIVFDMRRHLRLRTHIRNLEQYEYDTELGKRLVIPDDVRDLIDILLTNKGDGDSVISYKDIVGAKGGGAVILSAGAPGTGKTLTAEVYSEVMERPLYTVQASQLGISATELEDELLKVFARSQRWGAILLIDEADVYVAARGSDLIQNAIVGVFLRTLEYYQGVLFMTTNRSDLVDDAIASRCIARFDYKTPSQEDQARLWAILAETAGIEIKDNTIAKIVEAHPGLSGRDIKNLLKLANLVSKKRGKSISSKMITFVKKFKPTSSSSGEMSEVGKSLDELLVALSRARHDLGGNNVGGED
jgi:hypothetical protein